MKGDKTAWWMIFQTIWRPSVSVLMERQLHGSWKTGSQLATWNLRKVRFDQLDSDGMQPAQSLFCLAIRLEGSLLIISCRVVCFIKLAQISTSNLP